VEETGGAGKTTPGADEFYQRTVEQFGAALDRLARAYEADAEKRRDLRQEIHFQLWRSFHGYDGRCSLRTWVYRVAHHVAASHIIRERRVFSTLIDLESLDTLPDPEQGQAAVEEQLHLARLSELIRQLKPLDRQVIVCWLEGMDAESIAEITGFSKGNVAVRVNRIKSILTRRFREKGSYAD
jgi:RNA polymerase sigma-70 factor, ECF subfamily